MVWMLDARYTAEYQCCYKPSGQEDGNPMLPGPNKVRLSRYRKIFERRITEDLETLTERLIREDMSDQWDDTCKELDDDYYLCELEINIISATQMMIPSRKPVVEAEKKVEELEKKLEKKEEEVKKLEKEVAIEEEERLKEIDRLTMQIKAWEEQLKRPESAPIRVILEDLIEMNKEKIEKLRKEGEK